MGLRLQTVAARQGWTWARDGVRLYLRRPVAFSAMLLLFLVATALWSVLPVVGLAALASLPLLSLGFMVASRSVLRGGLAHPGQFVEPLLVDKELRNERLADARRRRRDLLLLCALYGVGALVVVWWVGWVYGDAMDALREAMSKQGPSSTEAAQLEGLWVNWWRSMWMRMSRRCRGMPSTMWGIGSDPAESIEAWAVLASTRIAERTTTVPRSKGPTRAGLTATVDSGAPR